MATSAARGPAKGWLWLLGFGVVLTILTLVIFAIIRTIETYGGAPAENNFVARYIEHPITTAIHMITGIGFVVLAPLQFSARIRNRYRGFHRGLGRVLVIAAIIAGIYGLVSVVTYPVYGGVSSATAGWFFGPLYLFAVCRAFWAIRQKNIPLHREWMIRTFALGLGVGSQRIMIGLFQAFSDYSIFEIFGSSLWLGFAFNLLVAETWIARTRRTTTRRAAAN